jgi:hypothetical protein
MPQKIDHRIAFGSGSISGHFFIIFFFAGSGNPAGPILLFLLSR